MLAENTDPLKTERPLTLLILSVVDQNKFAAILVGELITCKTENREERENPRKNQRMIQFYTSN